jgi:hypothetical protein
MDANKLLGLMDRWVLSKPSARGQFIGEAELRLQSGGCGWIYVSLEPKNLQADLARLNEHLSDLLDRSEAKIAGEQPSDEPILPPLIHDRAAAHFKDLDELERILRGKKRPDFYFEDEPKKEFFFD